MMLLLLVLLSLLLLLRVVLPASRKPATGLVAVFQTTEAVSVSGQALLSLLQPLPVAAAAGQSNYRENCVAAVKRGTRCCR